MNTRVLGTSAMICAPAMLIEVLLLRGHENALITGIASMVFMGGWICSNIGMWQMRATGTSKWAGRYWWSNSSAWCWRSRSVSLRQRDYSGVDKRASNVARHQEERSEARGAESGALK